MSLTETGVLSLTSRGLSAIKHDFWSVRMGASMAKRGQESGSAEHEMPYACGLLSGTCDMSDTVSHRNAP